MISSRLINSIRPLTFGFLCALATSLPVSAAELIYLTYGPLSWSVKVASLETFAQDGTINKDLEFYLRSTSPEQRAKFREALLKPVDLNFVMLSRFFNSEMGEDILTRFGKGITIQGGRNGKYALRAICDNLRE